MKSDAFAKSLKRLERVKGIEPSYSAWKAAALPLSYTRVTGSLTRPGGGLNCPGGRFPTSPRPCEPQVPPEPPPLNSGADAAYIELFRNQRKEVIQCLLPSAVTSLGSPAELLIEARHAGVLGAWTSETKRARREQSRRVLF